MYANRDELKEALMQAGTRMSLAKAELAGLKAAEEGAASRDTQRAQARAAAESESGESKGATAVIELEAEGISHRESQVRAAMLSAGVAKKAILEQTNAQKLLEELTDGGKVTINQDGDFVISMTVPNGNYKPFIAKVATIPPRPEGHPTEEYPADVVFNASSLGNLDKLVEAVVDARIAVDPTLKGKFTAEKLRPGVKMEVEETLFKGLAKGRGINE